MTPARRAKLLPTGGVAWPVLQRFRQISILPLVIFLALVGFPGVGQAASKLITPEKLFHGYQLVEEWKIDQADALAKALLKEYPKSGDAHFLHARVEFFKGNFDFAWKILQQVDDSERSVKEFKILAEDTHKATADFVSRESEHFVFRFLEGPDEALVPYAEEVLERSYAVLGDLFRYRPKEKILIEFYPDRERLSRISPLTLHDINTSGTVALCKYNRIMMISPASLVRGYNWMDTLSHEYVHYLLTKKSGNNLPLWLHEGIAKRFESVWRGEEKYLTPLMETILAKGLKHDYLIPLDSMMPSLAKLKTAEDVQLAYAEVSTMVDYLVREKGEQALPILLDGLASGVPFDEALESVAGSSLRVFQENWKRFVKKQPFKAIPGLEILEIRFKKRDQVNEEDYEKMTADVGNRRTRDLTLLGDILRSRNRFEAAVLEYEKAFRETKSHSPILSNKLAKAYLQVGKLDKAETVLKQSLEYYPMFHTTLATLGEVYYTADRLEDAKTYFEKAVRVNPFNPFIHLRLIEIYDKLGKRDEKERQEKLLDLIA